MFVWSHRSSAAVERRVCPVLTVYHSCFHVNTHTLTRTQSYTLTYSNTAAGSSVCNNWELLPNLCCLHVLRLRSELTVQKGSRPIPSYSEGVFYDLDHLSMWMWPTLSEPLRTMAVLMRIKPFYFFCLFLFWWNITKNFPWIPIVEPD